MTITHLSGIEILDSRGKPTVRTFVTLDDGSVHQASVPSGASTGSHEALELRDGNEKRFAGLGVTKAVAMVNGPIAHALVGKNLDDVSALDNQVIELDGTTEKSHFGANAILSVSMALMRAAAYQAQKPLWRYIHDTYNHNSPLAFPRLMVNLINGGKHANWNFDIQEFIIIPTSQKPSESTRVAAEIFAELGSQLKKGGYSPLVGDEGGYSPAFTSNGQAYEAILKAASSLGYHNGVDFELGMDAAASEFFQDGAYVLKKDNKTISPQELIAFYQRLRTEYNVASFEDPFHEDDWDSFTAFTKIATHEGFQVVGDDFTVTNPARIQKAVTTQSANAVIIKPNQIGSLKETIEAIKEARKGGWKIAVSHRSGETEDAFIADLAYGMGADFIKTGSMSRSERLAKYNRLIEIENGF